MGNPVFSSNTYGNAFIYYTCDRDPTSSEPLILNNTPDLLIRWWNKSTNVFFNCLDTTASAMVWVKDIDANNISSFLSSLRTQSSVSRTLNSAFRISTTKDSMVSYSVDIAATLSLTSGQMGTVFLEIADDSGFTTNVQELTRLVYGNTGTLTLGLNLTQNVTGTLSGFVPVNKYVRLRTANTVGTPTFNYRSGQEVLF